MELLSDFNPADPISQLLRVIRIRSTVYCRSLMRAPWGFGVEAHGTPAFHVVTAGRCWLEVDDEPDHLALATGDLVVLPTGRRHWMRDDPATPATELEEIFATTPLDEHRRLHHGGHGARTGLLCGGFGLQGGDGHPLLTALPAVVHIRGVSGRPAPWLAATLALLSAETDSDAPGAEEVVSRLADALLIQALRAALAAMQSSDGPRVLALGDPAIATAIELIHRRPAHAWTVGELAAEAALSRSAFSARFRELVGESPKRYITRTRLAHAAALLHKTDASLGEIALEIGYGSEFSFAKAFKRAFGVAPGAYRDSPTGSPGCIIARRLQSDVATNSGSRTAPGSSPAATTRRSATVGDQLVPQQVDGAKRHPHGSPAAAHKTRLGVIRTSRPMPRTVQDILDHSDELAKRFEDYEPAPEDERDAQAFAALRRAVESRARAERSIVAAVAQARASGYSWRMIGSFIGTSGEAARQRYGSRRVA